VNRKDTSEQRSCGWLEILLKCYVFTGNMLEDCGLDSLPLVEGRLGEQCICLMNAIQCKSVFKMILKFERYLMKKVGIAKLSPKKWMDD